MAITFQLILPTEIDSLGEWLCQERWPYHGREQLTRDQFRTDVDQGVYFGDTVRSFWILEGEARIGFIRLFDLEDMTPLFDLRIRSDMRGKGIGRLAVEWLTREIFRTWTHVRRIEAYTRADNVPMQRVLIACGYRKEAHHRKAWPDQSGNYHDSVGYAILKEEVTDSRNES